MLFASILAATAGCLLSPVVANSLADDKAPSLAPRQWEVFLNHDPKVICVTEGKYDLSQPALLKVKESFNGFVAGTTWHVSSLHNLAMADDGGVKVTAQLIGANETHTSSSVQSMEIANAIGKVITKCGSRGGSAFVAPTANFRVHVLGDILRPIVQEFPGKRQEDVRPDRPGLPSCNKLSLCFEDRDQILRDCILSANGDRDAITQYWREHSDGLAEWCRCSNQNEAESGYPVLSDANSCFISNCLSPYNECVIDGGDNCTPPSAECMNTCLPPKELHQQQPICDSTTSCFRDCDIGLQKCMLDARRDVHKVYQCWADHTTCASQKCMCDDTADQEGYPVVSEAGMCIRAAYYNLTIACLDDNCDAAYPAAVKSCISEKKVARSLAPRADYKEFSFFLGQSFTGAAMPYLLENNVCNLSGHLAKDDPNAPAWKIESCAMQPGTHCRFWKGENCQGDVDWCDNDMKQGRLACNLGYTKHHVGSVKCWW